MQSKVSPTKNHAHKGVKTCTLQERKKPQHNQPTEQQKTKQSTSPSKQVPPNVREQHTRMSFAKEAGKNKEQSQDNESTPQDVRDI
jgi:hypothetical protein